VFFCKNGGRTGVTLQHESPNQLTLFFTVKFQKIANFILKKGAVAKKPQGCFFYTIF
jgi:hypothetical protein